MTNPLNTANISVGTTATVIAGPGNVLAKNNGPLTVFVGNANTVTADLSATGGYQLHPGEELSLTNSFSLYGVTATDTSTVAVLANDSATQ